MANTTRVLVCADAPFASLDAVNAWLTGAGKVRRLDKVVKTNTDGSVIARVDVLLGSAKNAAAGSFHFPKGSNIYRARPYIFSEKTFLANKAGMTIKKTEQVVKTTALAAVKNG